MISKAVHLSLLIFCVTQMACQDKGKPSDACEVDCSEPVTPDDPDAMTPEDRSDELFAKNIVEIDIDMPEGNWETLRTQYKSHATIFGTPDCRDQPVPNPYTYFPGTMRIDGDEIENVGFRKKAHLGSQSTLKPGLKVRFNQYISGQHFLGMDRFALNNSRSDPGLIRQCMSYQIFADAGLPAPRCTFADVNINGTSKGIYVLLEEIKEPFLEKHYGTSEGNLYEGTASDFRPEFIGGYEQENNKSDTSRSDLMAIFDVVQQTPDAEFIAALGELVDMEKFYRHWVAETMMWHRDGYSGNANNHFWYANPNNGGKFELIGWGTDATFNDNRRAGVPDSVQARGEITNRLYNIPESRAAYYEALDEFLANRWEPQKYLDYIESTSAILKPRLVSFTEEHFDSEIDYLTTYFTDRTATIAAARVAGEPEHEALVRDLPCRSPLGSLSGHFVTTWDTLGESSIGVGDASLTLVEDGVPSDHVFVEKGARAGIHTDGRTRISIQLRTAEDLRFIFAIYMPDSAFFDDQRQPGIHDLRTPPYVFTILEDDYSVSPRVRNRSMSAAEGIMDIKAFSMNPGDPIEVYFSGDLLLNP